MVSDKTAVIRDVAKSNYLVYSVKRNTNVYSLTFIREKSGSCTISGKYRTNFNPCTLENDLPPAVCDEIKGIYFLIIYHSPKNRSRLYRCFRKWCF